ncbi:hypothetical protein AAC387_Pa04g1542 [Persea americana]
MPTDPKSLNLLGDCSINLDGGMGFERCIWLYSSLPLENGKERAEEEKLLARVSSIAAESVLDQDGLQ